MEWIAFAGSIIGGFIAGLFTFIGVKSTLKYYKEKEKKNDLKKSENDKPRLEVVNCLELVAASNDDEINNDCNILLLNIEEFKVESDESKFYYSKSALKLENLGFVEYEFKNIGKTEIEDIYISTNNLKKVSAIELERRHFYIKEKVLNYYVRSNKRYIKKGQNLKVRIYIIKDDESFCYSRYPLTIWLKDINGAYWEQNFDFVNKEVEKTRRSSFSEFRKRTDIVTAIECFKNPYLW